MHSGLLLAAALGGLSGVALGALGAHGLDARLGEGMGAVWEVAVRYQLFHALVLLTLALAPVTGRRPVLQAAGWAFAGGILVFSGSLYGLVLSGVRGLGALAPVGGLALLAGWALLVVASLRGASDDRG